MTSLRDAGNQTKEHGRELQLETVSWIRLLCCVEFYWHGRNTKGGGGWRVNTVDGYEQKMENVVSLGMERMKEMQGKIRGKAEGERSGTVCFVLCEIRQLYLRDITHWRDTLRVGLSLTKSIVSRTKRRSLLVRAHSHYVGTHLSIRNHHAWGYWPCSCTS